MKLNNPEIRLEVTSRCNYKCMMCPHDIAKRPKGHMSMELFTKIIDETSNYGIEQISLVHLGEPMLDPFFLQRANWCRENYPHLKLVTVSNGSLLSKEVSQELINYKFNKIRFSFYGTNPESYAKSHGVNSKFFIKATENIKQLINLKKETGSIFPVVEIYFLVFNHTQDEVEEFKNMWEHLADGISIWKPHNWVDTNCFREIKTERTSCGRPWNGPVQINWDGKVVACCYDYDNQTLMGDISKEPLLSIINNKNYQMLRACHRQNKFEKLPYCNQCDQLNSQLESENSMVYTNIKDSGIGISNSNQYSLVQI